MRTYVLGAITWTAVALGMAWGQNFEVTPFIGGQANGGLDLSTSVLRRIEVQNGVNYGVSLGYLLGDLGAAELMWNHNKADTLAQFVGGSSDRKVFGLNTNQYLKDRQSPLRPFIFFGLGATNLSPDRSGVDSITRFTWALGAGAKYNFSKHLGTRIQAKWAPTYITSTDEGFWCDPFGGGCFAVGDNHYLHEFDITGGITFWF